MANGRTQLAALARCIYTTVLLTLVAARGASDCRADELLEKVRKNLYTAREDSIRLLENALREDDGNVAYWVALIHALDVNGEPYFAERTSRLALQSHPGHPELLIARAKALRQAAAWDQLDELGRQPDQHQRAETLKSLLRVHLIDSHGLRRTATAEAVFHAEWARRLIGAEDFPRASKVVAAGLKLNAAEPRLLDLEPYALAFEDRFDEALRAHARRGSKHKPVAPFVSFADCLVYLGQPRLAIKAYRGRTPKDAALRRVLAIAHAGTGNFRPAVRLIGNSAEDDLLRLRWDVQQGRVAEVKQYAPALIARHCTRGPGSWAAPRYALVGGSQGREYRKALAWLGREFPDKGIAIYQAFGTLKASDSWRPPEATRISNRRYIRWLRGALPKAGESQRIEMRRKLAELLQDQQQYSEAAEVLAVNAVLPANQGIRENGYIHPDAVRWSLLHRRIKAESLFQSNPEALIDSRQLLAEMRCKVWNCSRIERSKKWRDREEMASRLLKQPPGILAAVLDDLQPQVGSSEDRTPLVAIVSKFGQQEDCPALISTLRMTVPSRPDDAVTDNNRRSGDALHKCLEKITGVDGPDEPAFERAKFWSEWWRRNSERIVLGNVGRAEERSP